MMPWAQGGARLMGRGGQLGTLVVLGALVASTIVVLGGPVAGLLLVAGTALGLLAAYMPGTLLAVYLLSGTYKAVLQPNSPVDVTVVLAVFNAAQIVPLAFGAASPRVSRPGLALMAAIGVLYLAGVLYAPDQGIATRNAATYWLLILVSIIPAALRVGSDPRYVRQLLWTLFALGVVMVVAGLVAMSSSQRLEVFGASTIEVSRAALLVPIIGVTFVLRSGGPVVRMSTMILIPLAVLVAVAAGSRGPLVALAVIVGVGVARYVVHPNRINWRIAGAVVGVIMATVVVLAALGASLPTLSTSRFGLFEDFLARAVGGELDASAGDTSSARRVALFEVAAQMFEERPVLGYGTGGFAAISPLRLEPPFEAWPHNAILQYAAEFGVVGVALFAAVVVAAFRRRLPADATALAIRALAAFFLLNAMVSDDIYGARPTWGLLALVFVIGVPVVATQVAARTPADRRDSPGRTARRSVSSVPPGVLAGRTHDTGPRSSGSHQSSPHEEPGAP